MFWTSAENTLKPPIDPANQSVMVDEKPYHRTSHLSTGPDLMSTDSPSAISTVYGALLRGKEVSNNGPCLGTRSGPNKEYEWISYQETLDKVHWLGAGLIQAGNDPEKSPYVGISSANRAEWTFTDFACQAYSMVPVAMYDSLGLQACVHILNECEMSTVVCDKSEKLVKLLPIVGEVPSLRLLIVMEPVADDLVQQASDAGLTVKTFEDIVNLGKQTPMEPNPQGPDEVFSICYTSGTTGAPKGVVLTNRKFVDMVASIITSSKPHFVPQPSDVHLCYLPMAHNFERAVQVLLLQSGVQIGFFGGDVKLLMDDLATLKPTFFPSVPRLLNRIHDAVFAEVQSSKIKSAMLNFALSMKKKDVDKYIYRRDSIWDRLIFSKVQAKLGGRVRCIITGSAPLSDSVKSFLTCALGCMVMEGYGQTEAGAALTFTIPGENSLGHVGPPVPGMHIKLVDVPEMNYYAEDNIGEVTAKCSFLMEGYFKQPEKTAEALDEEGWLHTGDIGMWTDEGALKIVDRKKNVFKLSQGEYVATEKIENVYRSSPFVAQIYVDGDSLKPCLMAVVVPDELYLSKWAANNGFPAALDDFCRAEGAKELLLKDMAREAKEAGLMSFEQVKDIYLESTAFAIENELLTPTMKNKRAALRNYYHETFKKLYTDNNL